MRRRRIVFLTGGILFLGVIIIIIWLTQQKAQQNPVVMTIDGREVREEEFLLYLRDEKAETVSYYSTTYKTTMDEGFWRKEIDGSSPLQYAREQTKERMIRNCIIEIMLVEEGYIKDSSYESFLLEFKNENKEREQKTASGEVFYGLSQFDVLSFYSYYYDNLYVSWKEDYVEEVKDTISDEDLREYYESYVQTDSAFEDMKEQVKLLYCEAMLEEKINVRIQNAKVVINEEAYEQIEMP